MRLSVKHHTMTSVKVLGIFAILGFVAVCNAQERSPLDAVDIDSVFKNERLLKNYVDCLLDKRPCSKEGAELKKRLPNVLGNNCQNCSQAEKDRAIKVVRNLSSRRPDLWRLVKAKYDPTGERSAEFGKRHNLRL